MKEANEILKQIELDILKQVYILDGEESYFIDMITNQFEEKILQEHEKDFNFKIFYGKDTSWSEIVNECRSFPVFANRRLILVKEASQLKDFDKLESYIRQPASSTILLLSHKYKKIDGRGSLAKYIKSKDAANNVQYATFDKIKDYQISDWILEYAKKNQIKINTKNTDLLAAYLGNDLQKIANEIDKIKLNIKENEELSEDLIEKYIGISKDYNVFQYPKAIIEKNTLQTFKIVTYYMANPKEAPMVVITAMLYNEFCKIYKYHYAKNLPQAEQAKAIGISPFFIKDYQRAAQLYNLAQTNQAIQIIQQYNLHAIGMNIANNNINMIKELSYKLLSL